jgi:dimethylamine monooxygenase subunit A
VTVDQRLDTFTGPHLEWAGRSSTVSANPALPERFHVRVELQHLIRLPRLAAVLFLVRTQLRLGPDTGRTPRGHDRVQRC